MAPATPSLGEGKEPFHAVKSLFKPYQGDLFGNSGKDNTQGMLYLSRMDPSRDPKKTRLDTAEEQKRRSLAQLGVKEGEDSVAEQEAHRAAGEERRRRLAISLATLSKKPEKRANVVANGGVAALTKLSRSEESRTRSSCAEVFNNLATEKNLRQRMLDQGAAPAIIALAASSNNRHLRTQCVEALCKLAVQPGSEAHIIAEGGVSCLLVVQRAAPSLGEVCLKTLINLSCPPGPLDAKMDELNDAALQASLVFWVEHWKVEAKKVEEGAVRIIARAANRTTSVDVVRLCASTLCNFAGEGRARPKMSDSRTAQVREDFLASAFAFATVVKAWGGWCIALAFRVLSSDLKFAEIIVEGGAVDALIALTLSADAPCRLSCAQSLCNLIRFAVRLDYLIECGVVSALVRLADPGDEATSECCAAALYLFFCHPAVLALIDGREVIRALMDLCRVGTTSIRKRCVAAIWNMTNVEQVAHGGGSAAESIPMLLGLLQTESDQALKADCAAALYNLARNQDNCQAMIVSGAVPPIIVLANSGSFETKTQCMSILQRMLLGRAMPDEILTTSFVRTLLDMSKMEHRDTQQRVVIAVYRISCCKRGRELLLEEGAPESLIRLISKPNEEMRKGCANTLLNLASDPGREIEITKCGAVSVLLITALVASDSDDTRHACTKAMANLLCEKKAHHGMFKDGVVWGLASMSKSKDITIARLCSVALCNLSCEYWKDIAMSNSMQAVYTLARSDDEPVMSAGMKALHNVLLRAQYLEGLDHIFSSTVPIACQALQHDSREIRLVGLRLTNLVSTTSGSRQTAMRYGLLEHVKIGDFDDDEALCYSFCCALDKFALDPETRTAVLDSGCIANFPALCSMSGRNFARLAQFLYSVSCSAELVPRLVFQHDCIKVVTAVLEPHPADEREGGGGHGGGGDGGGREGKVGGAASAGSLDGARETCAALLFNLSTQDEVKTELVLKGGTRLASALWEDASSGARRDCSLVACNLAVGKVNTAKMVRHGAGRLLVELVTNTDPLKDADVRKRASAAFRNILCVSGNHVQLAEEGVIPALIDLAKTECPVVRRNCASALRSMTCKAEVRQLLIASGAIKVILDDATNQDADESLAIDNELLCEIEAESWVNGTRGILVESRAPALPSLEQNCSLLPVPPIDRGGKAAKAAKAAAAIKSEGLEALYSMPWQKLQALDVDLQEPDMEVSAKQEGAKRFDDPGIAAALAGDSDPDGPGGGLSSGEANRHKLEPKETSKSSGNDVVSHQGNRREEGGSSKTPSSRTPRLTPVSSLEAAPEEQGEESSDESGNICTTDEDTSNTCGRSARERRSRKHRDSPGVEGSSISLESSTSNNSRRAFGRPRRDSERMPDPSIVDWEVAVVMASNSGDDMVENYIHARKEIHPARRGSVNISSIGSPRRKSILQPAGSGSDLANVTSLSTTHGNRRWSVQPMGSVGDGRRPSNLLTRPQNPATSERSGVGAPGVRSRSRTSLTLKQQKKQGRRLSVPQNSNSNTSATRGVSVPHPAMAAAAAGAESSFGGVSSTSAGINGVSGGGVTEPEKSARTQRRTSFMLANNEMSSGTEEGLPVRADVPEDTKDTEDKRPTNGGGEAPAATALGLLFEAKMGRHGSVAREDTFDAAAGRRPLQQS
eukprot:g9231.t1